MEVELTASRFPDKYNCQINDFSAFLWDGDYFVMWFSGHAFSFIGTKSQSMRDSRSVQAPSPPISGFKSHQKQAARGRSVCLWNKKQKQKNVKTPPIIFSWLCYNKSKTLRVDPIVPAVTSTSDLPKDTSKLHVPRQEREHPLASTACPWDGWNGNAVSRLVRPIRVSDRAHEGSIKH